MALLVWCMATVLGLALQLPLGAANNHNCTAPTKTELLNTIYEDTEVTYVFNITSKSPEAIKLFNLGLLLTADFNQREARRVFRAALSYDNTCAMCWWGIAYSRGPYQNKPAIQPPSSGPQGGLYYSKEDRDIAVKAINYAAALLGLVSLGNVSQQASVSAAALLERASGKQPTSVRLMRRLNKCQSSGGDAGKAGALGRRQLLLSHLRPPPLPEMEMPMGPDAPPNPAQPENPSEPSVPVAPPSQPHMGQLARERHYVAAMFDRLSVDELWGERWALAEQRYARDMQRIADCDFDDAHALPLAAEALANLTPWDFVEPETGKPRNSTRTILQILDRALDRAPIHPLALHLKIHVTEAFTPGTGNGTAGEGTKAAEDLLNLFPALDHLQHMPSHNFVRVGRWSDAVLSNIASLRASVRGTRHCLASIYPEHNAAMLVFAASMGADLPAADVYARVLRDMPRFIGDAPSSLGFQWTAPLLVWSRFGVWRLVLNSAPPPVGQDSDAFALMDPAWKKQLQSVGAYDHLRTAGGARVAVHDMGETLSAPDVDVAMESSLDGVLRDNPGPLRAELKESEYSQDGADYAAVVWLFSRVLGLANLLDTARLLAGDPLSPPPPPPPPSNAPRPPSPIATDEQAKAMGEQAGMFDSDAAGRSQDSNTALWALVETTSVELNETIYALYKAVELVPPDEGVPPGQGLGVIIPGYELLAKVHQMVADARVFMIRGHLMEAAAVLEQAVKVEEGGGYYEPPRVGMQPVRQCLGALQLVRGRLTEAITVYLEDLARYPGNPWSLTGLLQSLQAAEKRFRGEQVEVLGLSTPSVSGFSEPLPELQGAERDALQTLVAAANTALNEASEANKDAMHMVPNSCPAFFLPRRPVR